MFKTFKSRFKRRLNRRKKAVENVAVTAEDEIERLFFRRLPRLENVRRFVFAWVGLLALLIISVGLQSRGLGQYYQKIAPTDGGILREGVVGTFSNANPLYASNVVDSSVSRLVFSGLFTYDDNNQLIPDLAEKLDSDDNGQVYKVRLRKNIKWHDNMPFSAADVEFTYKTIQNPDAKSPLLYSWQGVAVSVIDDYTIQFALPSPLASFPYSLTNGIVPKHLLESVPLSQLRSVAFNNAKPVGTGPFVWDSVEVLGTSREKRNEQVALKKNPNYHLGSPRLDGYILKTFRDEASLINAFEKHELSAIVGLDKVPSSIAQDSTSIAYNVPMTGSVMLFFKNSTDILQDQKVRQALAAGTDRADIINQLGFPVLAADGPLLKGQLAYDPKVTEQSYSAETANKLLDQAGWARTNLTDTRKKDGKPLKLLFVSQNIAEYSLVSQILQKQWRALGVEIDVKLKSEEEMQSDVLTHHSYDVLLYGISIGPDPDVFAYWHSSQTDVRSNSRLNLSEYKSKAADKALEAGRTRTDPTNRVIKYRPFLAAWQADVPALAIYQPRSLYIARRELTGFSSKRLNTSVDRLNSIQRWTILQDHVIK